METKILEAVETSKMSVCSPVKVWKFPEPGKNYILSADPCLGTETDSSNAAIEVIDAETGEQCAEFAQVVSPENLAPIIFDLAKRYNNAEVAVEVNSVGMLTNKLLIHKFNYENIYRFKRLDRLQNTMTDIVGWWTDYKSKAQMEAIFRDFLGNNIGLIHSKKLLNEILFYNEDSPKPNDRFAAMMIALAVRDELLKSRASILKAEEKP
jgi:hypothetical protein